jgi:hypothetical protein
LYPQLKFKYVGSDSFYHLQVIREIRKNKLKLPEEIDAYSVSGAYTYPPLLHYIFAILPEKYEMVLYRYFSAIVDTIQCVLVYGIGWVLFGRNAALISTVIYAVIPKNIGMTSSFNPRPLGNLFVSCSVVALLLYVHTGMWMFVVLSVILNSLVLHSHKLSTQFLFFLSVVLSLCFGVKKGILGLMPIGTLLLGFLFAIIISKGHYMVVLKDHIRFLRFHFKSGNFSGKKIMGNPLNILKYNPWLFLLVFLVVKSNVFVSLNAILLVCVATSVFLYFFWVWGDSSRYLEYASLPSAILCGGLLDNNIDAINSILFGVIVVMCIVAVCAYWKKANFVVDENFVKCLKYFTTISEKEKVLCLHVDGNYIAAYFSNQQIIGGEANFKGLKYNLEELFPGTFKENLSEFMAKIHPDYICCNRVVYGGLEYKEIYKLGAYSIYKV